MSHRTREVPTAFLYSLIALVVLFAASTVFFVKNMTLSYAINLPPVPEPGRVAFTYGEQPALSDPNFFARVKGQFINDGADFIEADLSALKLRVYRDGELALEVPIDTKGREGSWWETPAGLYKVNSKEKAHFSGMGHVWMPWSLNFQGNFYIHGRTYYPDGTLTSTQFTGGCIRLLTDDAKQVYDLATIGMPVLVYEHSFTPDTFVYESESGPTLAAPIHLSADLRNNHVFAAKGADKVVPIASLTKLMTALVTTEYINLDATAKVPKEALVFTSKPRLTAGAEHTIYQLLFPLLMESSNEAAETIARYYGRTAFIKHMNEKAASIGMKNTRFTDVSGADAGNVSSAEDLFMLTKYIYNNRSFIFNITSGKLKNSAYGTSGFENLGNFNDFIDRTDYFGGKNGQTTAAGETTLTVLEMPMGLTKRPVLYVVLGSPNARDDGARLIEFTEGKVR